MKATSSDMSSHGCFVLLSFLGLFFCGIAGNYSTSADADTLTLSRNFSNHEKFGNYTFRWPNGSSIIWYPKGENLTGEHGEPVDCFGMGRVVAGGLEWFFKKNENSVDVRFFMSSRANPRRVEVLVGRQFGLEWVDFSSERRTIVIVHGFLAHGGEHWIRKMEEAFHLWGDVNVIVVDWSAHGNTWNYYKAAVNAQIVGRQISKLLHHIVNATNTSPSIPAWGKIHLVGHSLGAHICGIAARNFKKISTPWRIARITGLDPAQPCFQYSRLSLHKSAADFVDIIHTNGKIFTDLGLGLPEPIGHMDFYPNGGKRQPICTRIQSNGLDYLGIPKTSINQAICSHGMSYVYFTESIISAVQNNCTFCGRIWDRTYRHAQIIINETISSHNCVEMGLRAETSPMRGSFLVITSFATPFCDTSSADFAEIEGQLRVDFSDDYRD